APHEPDSSGPWLSLLADTLRGDTWIGDVAISRIEPVTRGAVRFSKLALPVNGQAWQGGGSWSSLLGESGGQAWSVQLGANDARVQEHHGERREPRSRQRDRRERPSLDRNARVRGDPGLRRRARRQPGRRRASLHADPPRRSGPGPRPRARAERKRDREQRGL